MLVEEIQEVLIIIFVAEAAAAQEAQDKMVLQAVEEMVG
jgi:hypothetical protein